MKLKVFQINIKSFNKKILKIYILFLINILKIYNIEFSVVNIPKKTKKITLLKSPHVHKKAREQFEINIYKKTIFIKNINKRINQLLLNKPKLININIKFIGK